jgi:small subunit ribosomal protein S21
MKVEVRNNNIDGALRILKKKMQSENVFNELRRKEFHESRGARKRREKNASIRRYRREMQKRKDEFGY